MKFETYIEAIKFIQDHQNINYDESFELSKFCSKLLRTEEKLGRDLVIRIHDIWEKIPEQTKSIWNDITESAGLYPYVNPDQLSKSALLRYEYHRSPFLKDILLHAEQQILSMELQSQKSLVVSAPTSFGKSLLIEELVASRLYNQIVIIQPTLALLDETRKKLIKYRDQYKIIVSTSQEPEERKGNLFLFTGERVVEYDKFSQIDFFIIDEFYKLSLERDDDRAIALNQAFYKLLKLTNKFYLLGPIIKSIPLNFQKKFDLVWYPTEFATVAVDESTLLIKEKVKKKEKDRLKRTNLYKLLSTLNDQTIIYCSSPNKATTLAFEFVNYLINEKIINNVTYASDNKKVIEWIEQNINTEWSLNNALMSGVAFHHGALPRHLGSSIVDSFNNGAIRWLFCTSTLIEGVNTSAKNVILFDKEKGRKEIDFFDYKNIAGRSGRMKMHFIGNVIRFEPEPDQMDLFVDIPIFNQENAPLEILISMDEADIEKKTKSRLKDFEKLPQDLQEVIRSNAGIAIDSQLAIIKTLETNLRYYNSLLNWSHMPPNFDSLSTPIELCWDVLLGPGDQLFIENIGRLSARWLASFTFSFINLKSINAIISNYVNDKFWIEKIPELQKRNDVITYAILHVSRHWFDYKLPKWLSIISNLQKFVYEKANMTYGNYTYLASNIENSFLPLKFAALSEYDIPNSAIKKLSKYIRQDSPPEENILILNQFTDLELKEMGLIQYEIEKLRHAF